MVFLFKFSDGNIYFFRSLKSTFPAKLQAEFKVEYARQFLENLFLPIQVSSVIMETKEVNTLCIFQFIEK